MSAFGEIEGLTEAVEGLERRLRTIDVAFVSSAYDAYLALVPRLEEDFPEPREALLARAAALMLVQAMADRA